MLKLDGVFIGMVTDELNQTERPLLELILIDLASYLIGLTEESRIGLFSPHSRQSVMMCAEASNRSMGEELLQTILTGFAGS
jgi:hypothetical protein